MSTEIRAASAMYQSICWPLLLTGFLCGGPATRRWVGWLRTSASARSSSRRSTWTSSAGSSAPVWPWRRSNARLGLTLVTLANAAEAGRALAPAGGPTDGGPEPEVDSDLDRVLTELRLSVRAPLRRLDADARQEPHAERRPVQALHPRVRPADRPGCRRRWPRCPRPDQALSRVSVGLFDTVLAPHRQLTGSYLADPDTLVGPVEDDGGERLWWEGHATFIAGIIRRHAPSAVLDVRTALRRVPGGSGDERWSMPLWDFADLLADYQDAGVAGAQPVGRRVHRGRPGAARPRAGHRPAHAEHGRGRGGREPRLTPHAATAGRTGPATPRCSRPRWTTSSPSVPSTAPVPPRSPLAAPGRPTRRPGSTSSLRGGRGQHLPRRRRTRSGCSSRAPTAPAARSSSAGWAAWSGTSFATGEITGAVANLLARGDSPPDAVKKIRPTYPRP